MGVAAYNRGNKAISQETDREISAARYRAERQALKDENARLRERVAALERDLKRACRCLAAERYAREKRVTELKADVQSYRFGTSLLCRIAFPSDPTK